jgi:hypothetical protein
VPQIDADTFRPPEQQAQLFIKRKKRSLLASAACGGNELKHEQRLTGASWTDD